MRAAGTEAFPLLATTSEEKPTALSGPNGIEKQQTRRRKSSGLGGEITAGDTGAPAFATLNVRPESPGAIKVSQPDDNCDI
jgi:acyl-CoA-dependent ceramide synthase